MATDDTTTAERVFLALDYDYHGYPNIPATANLMRWVWRIVDALGGRLTTRRVLTRGYTYDPSNKVLHEIPVYAFADGSELGEVTEGIWMVLEHCAKIVTDDGREIIDTSVLVKELPLREY